MGKSTGRQTRSAPIASTSKPSKLKKSKKLISAGNEQNLVTSNDLYEYSSSIKRARGDVDPEARASFGNRKGKGKPVPKVKKPTVEGEEEEDSEEDEQAMFYGEEIVEFTGVKPEGLYMGGDEDGEIKFGSSDDESINSDDAMEEFDDLPKIVAKGKKAPREVDIDLEEEEIDFEDEEGGAYMDASEMLDAGDYDSEDSGVASDPVERRSRNDQDSEQDPEDESDDSELDEEYEGALMKLGSFVDGLESSKKRKANDEVEDGKKKKRVVLRERTETFAEGEFVAITTADGVPENKVNLEDLLSTFATSKNPKLIALRKTLKPLLPSTAASASSGPLAAPLPARLQDKIEREAGSERTKEETDKWNETVRRMKGHSGLGVEGARHERLVLPLGGGAGGGSVARDANANEWSSKFEPSNDMERSIHNLLLSGQMSANDVNKAEKATLQALDPQQVIDRQILLSKQRDLLFRSERKAARISKIKSKAFRRIHRKEKIKNGLSLEDMEEMDRIDGGDRVVEEKAKMEIARAKERVTLKHSAKGGRWSKQTGGIEGLDEERNTAVREMVARGQLLRKRIIGDGNDGEQGDEFEGGSEEDDDDASLDQIRRTAFDELSSLDRKDSELEQNQDGIKSSSVLNMKFMKDAAIRDQRQNQIMVNEFKNQMEAIDRAGEDRDDDAVESDDEFTGIVSAKVDGNMGRMVFGPSGSSSLAPSSLPVPVKSTTTTTKLTGNLSVAYNKSPLSLGTDSTASISSNPWLNPTDESSTGKISRKMNKATVSKDAKASARSKDKMKKDQAKLGGARELEMDDEVVEINPSIILNRAPAVPQINATPSSSKSKKEKKQKLAGNSNATLVEDGIGSSDEEDDDDQVQIQRGKGPAAFKQRDLVARAFAGDNVVADFEADKRREIERDAPKEIDNTLPGWGGWAGKGVKKSRNAKKFITKVAGIEPAARKDSGFSNVIISEKKTAKKNAKYLLKDLPFPFTSIAQYETKLATPLGAEWSTETILRDRTMPKILIKPGVAIRPVGEKI